MMVKLNHLVFYAKNLFWYFFVDYSNINVPLEVVNHYVKHYKTSPEFAAMDEYLVRQSGFLEYYKSSKDNIKPLDNDILSQLPTDTLGYQYSKMIKDLGFGPLKMGFEPSTMIEFATLVAAKNHDLSHILFGAYRIQDGKYTIDMSDESLLFHTFSDNLKIGYFGIVKLLFGIKSIMMLRFDYNKNRLKAKAISRNLIADLNYIDMDKYLSKNIDEVRKLLGVELGAAN